LKAARLNAEKLGYRVGSLTVEVTHQADK